MVQVHIFPFNYSWTRVLSFSLFSRSILSSASQRTHLHSHFLGRTSQSGLTTHSPVTGCTSGLLKKIPLTVHKCSEAGKWKDDQWSFSFNQAFLCIQSSPGFMHSPAMRVNHLPASGECYEWQVYKLYLLSYFIFSFSEFC